MTKRPLPNTQAALNAAANNGQINYFITPPELADYYFAKIDDASLAGFRGKLLDYYIEAADTLGNVHKSEIQHVFVEDDGQGGGVVTAPATPDNLAAVATGSTGISVTWSAVSGATSYEVRRSNTLLGTTPNASWLDSGLQPSTSYAYTVTAVNSAGSSAPTASVSATTDPSGGGTEAPDFAMDGVADSPGYLISHPGMTIHAAVRGNKLYVATWAPGAFGNDHFILVGSSALATPTTPAPWGKAGTLAVPPGTAFLAAESSNTYIGWFNTNGAATTTARGADGQQMEGTIELTSPPSELYLAALAYQTADGGLLGSQAPAGNGDGNVDAGELLRIPLEALRDEDANGLHDLLEPGKGFKVIAAGRQGNSFRLSWAAFPGRSYKVQASDLLGEWSDVSGSEVVADSLVAEFDVALDPVEHRKFFRVMLVP
jgi:hypothetical protein